MVRDLFAPCTLGLETILQQELVALGAGDTSIVRGGVRFRGDRALAYRSCLWLRSAVRVQELLAEARVSGPDGLYAWARSLDWAAWMGSRQTLAVDASVKGPIVTHGQFAALRIKDAIVDNFREAEGRRPAVDRERPDLPIRLVVREDEAALYRDLAGASLHKRGYRPILVKAPLNEAIAAGLLQLAEWDRKAPLLDPMCGSGTFVIEAAMLAADRAPGLGRHFAFENWLDHDRVLWARLRKEAERRFRPGVKVTLAGSDRHRGAIDLARKALRSAGLHDLARFQTCEIGSYEPTHRPEFVVSNPPWGERLSNEENAWRELGTFLHERCAGATAYLLSGDPGLTRHLRLRADRRWPVRVGPIDCRFIRYDIGSGREEEDS